MEEIKKKLFTGALYRYLKYAVISYEDQQNYEKYDCAYLQFAEWECALKDCGLWDEFNAWKERRLSDMSPIEGCRYIVVEKETDNESEVK